jgi:hypothetical protein
LKGTTKGIFFRRFSCDENDISKFKKPVFGSTFNASSTSQMFSGQKTFLELGKNSYRMERIFNLLSIIKLLENRSDSIT